jgi:outer membrane protein assembly factor BamD
VSRAVHLIVFAVLASAMFGCPKDMPPNMPADEYYRLGLEKFERRDWRGSIQALQRFLFEDPGHQKVDSAQLLIGESYYNQKQYLTAAGEFLRLAQNRPAGQLADDARYRACQSYYNLSPRPELDQEYTEEAIDQCRAVALLYPGSPYASEAALRVKELTDKLARKHYLNAVYYIKRRAYDSAIVYLEYLLETYRGAAVEPEALLKLYETYTKLGYVDEAEETRGRLLSEYPDSPEASKVPGRQSGESG